MVSPEPYPVAVAEHRVDVRRLGALAYEALADQDGTGFGHVAMLSGGD